MNAQSGGGSTAPASASIDHGMQESQAKSSSTVTSSGRSMSNFSLVSNFHDDIIINILSYLSDVPYQSSSTEKRSMLTHDLPLVSRHFNSLCKDSDYLWKLALQRIIVHNPSLWKQGLLRFISHFSTPTIPGDSYDDMEDSFNRQADSARRAVRRNRSPSDESSSSHTDNGTTDDDLLAEQQRVECEQRIASHLLQQAYEYAQRYFVNHNVPFPYSYSCYRHIYKWILCNYIRFTSPLFHMADPSVRLGQDFGLHFFEPRYRLLIAECMQPFPEEARRGGPILPLPTLAFNSTSHTPPPPNNTTVTPFSSGGGGGRGINNTTPSPASNVLPVRAQPILPTFIYSNNHPLEPGSIVCLVQVRQCRIHENGTADVMLCPVSYARVEYYWKRPNSPNLYEATVSKLGQEETRQFEYSKLLNIANRYSMQVEGHPIEESIRQWLQQHADNLSAGHY